MTLAAQIDTFNGQCYNKDANGLSKIDVFKLTLPSWLPYTKMHFIVSITSVVMKVQPG